jgi:hypothetical protein
MKKLLSISIFLILILGGWNQSHSFSGFHWDSYSTEISYPKHFNNEFFISGPDELCIYFGNVIGEFFGGGRSTDVYLWRLKGSDGNIIVEREGGFQTFSHTFSEEGDFELQLTVRRGIHEVFSGSKSIKINFGADLILKGSYLLCEDGTATLTLINPESDNTNSYQIEWFDSNGNMIGTGNSIVVKNPDLYKVNLNKFSGEIGAATCPMSLTTFVYQPKDYSLSISDSEVCFSGTDITVTASKGAFGQWFFRKEESDDKTLLGEGNTLVFRRGILDGPGNYDIIFEVDNRDNEYCKLTDLIPLNLIVQPRFQFYFESGSESCESEDGVLVILPAVDLDYVQLRKDNVNLTRFFDLKQGVELRIPGMKAGVYRASGAVGSCTTGRTAVVPLSNPSTDLLYSIEEIIDETCNDRGKIDGSFKVKMLEEAFGRNFIIYNTGGVSLLSGVIENNEFEFSGPSGNFYFEIFNQEGCVNPSPERINIQSKGQVSFSTPNRITVCETFDFIPDTNENLIFTLTYPDNTTDIKTSGEAFVLDQEGKYTLIGVDADLERAFCPRESSFDVHLTSPVEYEPELVSRDCFGNQEYRANLFGADPGRVDIKWYNENNQVVGTELVLFPTTFGEFKLDVQPRNSEFCPKPSKSFIVNEPILKMDILLEANPLCGDSYSVIRINNESENIGTVKWIFFDSEGNASELVDRENQLQIEVDEAGVYEAVVYNDLDCEIGRSLVSVKETSELALFEIPERIVVCDFFELDPDTSLELTYFVVMPDGSELVYGKGESLLVDQDGVYTVTSSSQNPDVLLCPVTKTLLVEKSSFIDFELELFEQDCEGKLVFKANLFGIDISEVDVFWYNELGTLVGEAEFLTPQSYGEFSLEVRPKDSQVCPQPNNKMFEVIKPVIELDGGLTVSPFCPDDENVTITLDADLNQVNRINWYFTDFNGQKRSLDTFVDFDEIIVTEQGTYEVEVFNEINCLLGRDMVIVMKSMDQIRPEVESVYEICPSLGVNTNIDPGNFESYQWFLEGDLVSEAQVFEPIAIGNYSLTVTSVEGCQYTIDFLVTEVCELMVKSTTGMKVNDVEKPFMVYTNSLVNRLDIWIYNNWGQLIYSCSKDNLAEGESYCIWYGDFNGGYIQPGNYSVKISVKNYSDNAPKNIYRSLMVIE